MAPAAKSHAASSPPRRGDRRRLGDDNRPVGPRGYIRSSQSEGEPRVYSLEDVAEAAVVRAVLERGVGHAQVRRAIKRLRAYGDWQLSDAPLVTTTGRGRPRVVLREHDAAHLLSLLERHPDRSRSFPPHRISPADLSPIQCHWLPLVPGRSRPVPLPIPLPLTAPSDLPRPLVKHA